MWLIMRGEKPAPGVLKINSHGCFNPESSDGRWGLVLYGLKQRHASMPWRVLRSWASDAIVETDAAQLVTGINNYSDLAPNDVLFRETKTSRHCVYAFPCFIWFMTETDWLQEEHTSDSR